MFWKNLSKQKFMHFAAGALILFHIINSVSLTVILSSNIKILSPEIFERMSNFQANAQYQIITIVLLYFFGNKYSQNNNPENPQ